jgi:RimJ/RimL family protein N-acetyltransferase
VSAGASALPLPDPALADQVVSLRSWAASDLPDLMAGVDATVRRFRYSVPHSEAEARSWLDLVKFDRWRGKRLELAVVDRAAQRPVGSVSIWDIDPVHRSAMISYWMGAAGRGRGLTTHAVGLLANWAFRELGLERLTAEVELENHASQRLAERCGFANEGRLRAHRRGHDGIRVDSLIYGLVRDSPKSKAAPRRGRPQSA